VEYMVRHLHSSAEQFIIGNVTQLVEPRQVQRAVPVTPRTIQHRVDVLAVWRFGKTAQRAGGIRQTSDGGGTIQNVMCCRASSSSPRVRSTRSA